MSFVLTVVVASLLTQRKASDQHLISHTHILSLLLYMQIPTQYAQILMCADKVASASDQLSQNYFYHMRHAFQLSS